MVQRNAMCIQNMENAKSKKKLRLYPCGYALISYRMC